jgi:hypothetical protein
LGQVPSLDNALGLQDIYGSIVGDIRQATLRLSGPRDEEGATLLRATDALRLCHEGGHEAPPTFRALACFDRFDRRQGAAVRVFVSEARLAGVPLVNLDTQSLFGLLRGLIRKGELAVVRRREGGERGGDARDVEQRRLVREIEAKTQRRLSYAGRHYRLVVDANLSRLPDRDRYEVVSHRDAVQVLHGLAGQGGAGGTDLSELLRRAAELLTRDWRPPQSPDGLVLLRRIIVQTPHLADLGPALTPSQLKQLAKSDWIEVEVIDQDGDPYVGHYRLELPDKTVREGELDEEGLLAVYEIESGSCTLAVGEVKAPATGPEVDEPAPTASDAESRADSEVAEAPEPPAEALGYADDLADEYVDDEYLDEDQPETKPIFFRLHMDPARVAALKEEFRLFSTDGSYSRTEATDRIPGNAYMDLMFDDAPTELSYSLEISGPGRKPYLVFEAVPFAKLKGLH